MANVKDLLKDQKPEVQLGGLWHALITSPVPALDSDPLYVIIPDVSTEIKWGPCRWNLKSIAALINVSGVFTNLMIPSLPILGGTALVAFDNRGDPWVLMYA